MTTTPDHPRSNRATADVDITGVLMKWSEDREAVLNQLAPLVYSELRKLAASYLSRDREGHTLQPTALVHEAYIKLVKGNMQNWEGRAHFFGIAARLMRQILSDSARRFHAQKRSAFNVSLDENMQCTDESARDFLALDEALLKLEVWDSRKARVVELKYFSGLNREEIADFLDLSLATVKRDLSLGEAFLRRELAGK